MTVVSLCFLHLLVLAAALALGCSANRCLPYNITDLGTTDEVSSEGIASRAVGFPVRIQRFNTLCLSPSDFLSFYQSTSVLIEYFCPDCPGTNELKVEQFTFDCSFNAELSQYFWDSRTVIRAIPGMSVNFDTQVSERCGFCEHPNRIEQEMVPISEYNLDTHCIRCREECGLRPCFFNFTTRRGPGVCCLFEDNGRCVESCEPMDGHFRAGDTVSQECANPTFRVNGGDRLPLIGSANAVAYVHDPSLTGDNSPLTILCLYTSSSLWTITEGLPQAPFTLEAGGIILPDQSTVSVSQDSSSVTINPTLRATLTFTCQHRGETTPPAPSLQITTFPENPYLSVTGPLGDPVLISDDAIGFNLNTRASYTLNGIFAEQATLRDFIVYFTQEDGSMQQGVITTSIAIPPVSRTLVISTSLVASSSDGAVVMNLVNQRAVVRVVLSADGGSLVASRTIQVIRETLPPLPSVSLVNKGEPFRLDCTPTTSTDLTYTSGFQRCVITSLGDPTGPCGHLIGGVRINETVLTDATQYTCSAYENTVTRVTFLIVFPAISSGLEIFALPSYYATPQANEAILGPRRDRAVDFWFSSFPPTCVGRQGHGELMWFVEGNSELQKQLREINGVQGTHRFTVGQFVYTVIYSAINGSDTINMASLNISGLSNSNNFTSRFKCFSGESGEFKYFTITSRESILLTQPSRDLTVSLGQELVVDLYFASIALEPFRPVYMVNGQGVEILHQFTPDKLNSQHQVFSSTVVPQMEGINEFFLTLADNTRLTTGFNLIVTTPSLELTPPEDAREFEVLEILCTPSEPNVRVRWLLFNNSEDSTAAEILTDSRGRFQLTPPNLNHRLRIESATAEDSRIYSCEVEQNPSINSRASVRVRERCEFSYSAGLLWGSAYEGDIIYRRCRDINFRFNDFVRTHRRCIREGSRVFWSDVQLGECTLRAGVTEPFIMVWLLYFQQPTPILADDVAALITAAIDSTAVDSGVSLVADSASVSISSLSIPITSDGVVDVSATPIFYVANISSSQPNVGLIELFPSENVRLRFPRIVPSNETYGFFAFRPSSVCGCFPEYINASPEVGFFSLWPLCVGYLTSPCNCSSLPCLCSSPTFLGNSNRGSPPDIFSSCVPDSDQDTYPDLALSNLPECAQGCLDTGSRGFVSYCCEDTCPTIYNPDQTQTPCLASVGERQCPAEVDEVFGFQWGFTSAGRTVKQPCGFQFIGNASRECALNGTWFAPNVSSCIGVTFTQAMQDTTMIRELLDDRAPYNASLVETLLENAGDLAAATGTGGQNFSRLPQELGVSAAFVQSTIDYLVFGADDVSLENFMNQSRSILTVLSNLVSPSNLPGSMQLLETNPDTTFSQDLLNSAERYGLYFSTLLDQSNSTQSMTFMADNILVNAQSVDVSDQREDLVYPSDEGLNNTSSIGRRLRDARVIIPASVLRERASLRGRVRVSNVLFQNVELFLPTDFNGALRDPVTLVLSSQVEEQRAVQALTDPVTLTFTATNQSSDQNFSCVFFDFAIGEFSTEGVTTGLAVPQDNGDVIINCTSNHLTSFAVLVNIGGENLTSRALSVVSYIGLGISLICLLATIIFFLSFGKQLFSTGVHNFVHLNLAIALFLAYLLFALGVELGARHKVACQVVTAFLHYLFLAVFCWMLSEGVMLYLILVVVFSTLAKKWWFFMILGWVPPIPFVVIGLAAVLNQYGVYIDNRLAYCWLASGSGQHAIWTFVAPMLAIMLINAVFLLLVLVSLVRNKRRKQGNDGKRIDLVKNTIKASIILLPLLGLTWVFALFIVSRAAIVFAWIFTILNTLQGLAIFILHVLRHERIWGRLFKKSKLSMSTSAHESSSKVSYKKTSSTKVSYAMKPSQKIHESHSVSEKDNEVVSNCDVFRESTVLVSSEKPENFNLISVSGNTEATGTGESTASEYSYEKIHDSCIKENTDDRTEAV